MIWFVSLTWTYGTFWTTCSLETCRNELKLIVYTGRFLLRTLYLCSWHVNSRSLVIYLFKQLAHFLSTCIFLDQLLVAPLTRFFFFRRNYYFMQSSANSCCRVCLVRFGHEQKNIDRFRPFRILKVCFDFWEMWCFFSNRSRLFTINCQRWIS